MKVRVRLFAGMAQQADTGLAALDMPAQSTVAAVRKNLQLRFPQMPWPPGTMHAVNQEYADEQRILSEGDEVAFIPPVSGG